MWGKRKKNRGEKDQREGMERAGQKKDSRELGRRCWVDKQTPQKNIKVVFQLRKPYLATCHYVESSNISHQSKEPRSFNLMQCSTNVFVVICGPFNFSLQVSFIFNGLF